MKKTAATTASPRISLKKEKLKDLSASMLAHAVGGMMNLNPRTDCICCKACATNVC
ncbi:MAG: hypothetical protein K8W52_10340 [Deltaproteobacteria bacterium]|nr:hypothetical protein [Deltaproteobacteria bacterium]